MNANKTITIPAEIFASIGVHSRLKKYSYLRISSKPSLYIKILVKSLVVLLLLAFAGCQMTSEEARERFEQRKAEREKAQEKAEKFANTMRKHKLY